MGTEQGKMTELASSGKVPESSEPTKLDRKENFNCSQVNLTRQQLLLICEYWFRILQNDTGISIKDISDLIADYYYFYIRYKSKFVRKYVVDDLDIISMII